MTLEETLAKLDSLTEIIADQTLKTQELFYSDTPQDITIKRMNPDGSVVEILIPNMAKIVAQVHAEIDALNFDSDYADINHNHDDRYYQKSDIDQNHYSKTESDERFATKTILDFKDGNDAQPSALKLYAGDFLSGEPRYDRVFFIEYDSANPNPNNSIIRFGKNRLLPYGGYNPQLGINSDKWAEIHGEDIFYDNLNTPSDKRLKKNIATSPLGLDFISRLKPVSYRMKNTSRTVEQEDGTKEKITVKHSRKHYGLIAQDVKEILDELNIDTADFAGLCYDKDNDRFSLRYMEFIAPLIKAVQELRKEVEKLKRS